LVVEGCVEIEEVHGGAGEGLDGDHRGKDYRVSMRMEGWVHTLLRNGIVADAGVIDLGCLEIEVGFIAVVVHCICNRGAITFVVGCDRSLDSLPAQVNGLMESIGPLAMTHSWALADVLGVVSI